MWATPNLETTEKRALHMITVLNTTEIQILIWSERVNHSLKSLCTTQSFAVPLKTEILSDPPNQQQAITSSKPKETELETNWEEK